MSAMSRTRRKKKSLSAASTEEAEYWEWSRPPMRMLASRAEISCAEA
jgi:hypothetical protein